MRCRQRRQAEHVNVVLDGLPRRLVGGGKQRPDVDVESDVGEGRSDDLLSAIVAVLTDLGDQNARSSAFRIFECVDERLKFLDPVRHGGGLALVNAGNGFDFGPVTTEHFFHGV